MGLLVHTRRVGEKIRIGDDIEITVLEIDGNKIRLGFLAPRDVPIHRLEVWQRIRDEGPRPKPTSAAPATPRAHPRRRPA